MSALLQQVRQTVQRHALCTPASRLLIGVSGGSDSVALVFLLGELARTGSFAIAGLAHLNHSLRATADRDEAFCRALAERLGLRILAETADVQTYATMRSLSVEDAGRRIRYDFLERSADTLGADRIAVGHTQDDQAETFLLKLMRGAGLAGLAGIYPRRGRVVRPLLDTARLDLRRYLVQRGETWIEDETNDFLENPRNRVRHVILPELDHAAGGPTRPAIARAAGLVREDAEWLDTVAERRFEELATWNTDGLELDGSATALEPPAIRRRVLRLALKAGAGDRQIVLAHVESAMAVLSGQSGGLDFPGGRMELRRGKLVLIQQKVGAK